MHRGLALAGLVALGCGRQRDVGPGAGSLLNVRVDPAAVPIFDHLELYFGDGFMDPTPIATPAILAGTEPPAATALSWGGGDVVRIDHGHGYRHSWQLSGLSHPIYIGVAAVGATGEVLAGGSSGPFDGPSNLALTIALDPALRPELWGIPAGEGRCFRLRAGPSTFYVTRADDRDCDGVHNRDDPEPYAFCDPASTTGAGRAACRRSP